MHTHTHTEARTIQMLSQRIHSFAELLSHLRIQVHTLFFRRTGYIDYRLKAIHDRYNVYLDEHSNQQYKKKVLEKQSKAKE